MREDRAKHQSLLDSPDLFAAETPSAPLEPNFRNRTIWTGDNLYVLRGINSACVDLVYLDPPFNSNRTYSAPIGSQAAGAAFKDAWTKDDLDVAWHGEIADREPALHAVLRGAELAHGASTFAYLVMMGIRLLELRRILKPNGSIYLHCDDKMAAYLRLVMDAVFSARKYRNTITWKRNSSHNDSRVFGRVSDTILFYGANIDADAVRTPLNPEYVKRAYRHEDQHGRYQPHDLSAKGLTGGGYRYEFHGHPGPWRFPEANMRALEHEGRIHLPAKKGGVPRIKRYLHENKGQVPSSVWTDIPTVQGQAKERTGYPTQKPLALLDRIIRASSNEGDFVLDPFCGCATTCVAAELAGRKWAGIDLSDMAVHLLRKRLAQHAERDGDLFRVFEPVVRTDLPRRTDVNDPGIVAARSDKHILYGQQEGRCNGCRVHFPFRNLTVDHVVPRAHGGHDGIENKQLLCGACNSMKGTQTQQALVAKLKADGILA